jgi:DHA1 family bicyclomycin/chloramphenicol resistance-like MFS transporter
LVAITLVGPLSIHLFLPALPHIRQSFAIDAETAQLAFSLPMFAMAIATLFYGSLSDRFGRLPVLVGGMLLFAGGAALAAAAASISTLILGRILQGLGAASGMVLARAIVRDVYGAKRLGQMIAYLTAAYVVGPLCAPPIGGFLTDTFSWQSIQLLPMAFGTLGIIIAVVVIGETRQAVTISRSGLIIGYRKLIGDLRFTLFALNPAFCTGGFFALNTGASFLMIETFGLSAAEFGLYFMLGPIGFLLGNFLSGLLIGRVSGNFLIIVGSVVSFTGAVAMTGLIAWVGLVPIFLFFGSSVLTLGQGLAMPHAQAAAIATDPALTGTASGIVVFLQFLFAAGLTQLVVLGADGTTMAVCSVTIASSTLALVCGGGAVLLTKRHSRGGAKGSKMGSA